MVVTAAIATPRRHVGRVRGGPEHGGSRRGESQPEKCPAREADGGSRRAPELTTSDGRKFKLKVPGQAYDQVVTWLQSRIASRPEQPDLHAVALVLVESMSAYHSLRRTFGRAPDDVDDERFIAAWVETALAVARRFGLS
jgi:hypothetical protein